MKNNTRDLKKRPITSISVFISFIYLVPSGILIHIAEHGSRQVHHFAAASHWAASVIFLVAASIHIVLNWKAMKRYMFAEIADLSKPRKEFVIVFLAVTLLIVLFGAHEFYL